MTDPNEQQDSCLSRLLVCFSEKYLIGKLTGKDYQQQEIEDEIRRKLKFKRLSFYDYNEEKTGFLEIAPGTLDYSIINKDLDYLKGRADTETDNSEISSMSSFKSVDEGAVAALSMDQIRNMRLIQLNAATNQ